MLLFTFNYNKDTSTESCIKENGTATFLPMIVLISVQLSCLLINISIFACRTIYFYLSTLSNNVSLSVCLSINLYTFHAHLTTYYLPHTQSLYSYACDKKILFPFSINAADATIAWPHLFTNRIMTCNYVDEL